MTDAAKQSGDSAQRAPLAKGDRIYGSPCLVTVEHVTDTSAYGRCEACEDRHIIDRFLYEEGDGPWRLVSRSCSCPDPLRREVHPTCTLHGLEATLSGSEAQADR